MSKVYKIVGFPLYEFVENEGIYSLNYRQTGKRQLMKATLNTDGYPIVHLSYKGKQKRVALHRIAAELYFGRCPKGKQVNHKNGNKLDFSKNNLEYITHSENIKHYYSTLGHRAVKGEQHGRSKLAEKQVVEIKLMLNKYKNADIARKYNVCASTISYIRSGKLWGWLSV